MTATQQRTAMQQPAHARESTAPQLGPAAPWQPRIDPEHRAVPAGESNGRERARTPLALVPAPIRRSGRGFAALCVGILVAALLTVLVVNISVSNRQYQMVGLKNEQLDLSQSNELLRQQVEHLEAPQNLAAEAARLGMVMPGDIASIDLATGTVSGAATAAEQQDRPAGLVAAPSGPAGTDGAAEEQDSQAQDPDAVEAPAAVMANPSDAQAGGAANGQAAGEAPAADESSTSPADGGSATSAGAATDGEADRDQELNGGTIPAPQFSASSD